jgi:hypothetical protein
MGERENRSDSEYVIENKGSYNSIMRGCQKSMSLRKNALRCFLRGQKARKRGTPENEGISLDVYEK